MIGGCPLRKAIGVAREDVEGVEHPPAFLQVGHLSRRVRCHSRGEIAERAAQAMAPRLLSVMKMQAFIAFSGA